MRSSIDFDPAAMRASSRRTPPTQPEPEPVSDAVASGAGHSSAECGPRGRGADPRGYEATEDPDVPETPAPDPAEVPAPAPESAPPAPVATAEPASPPTAESAPEAEDVVEPRPAKRSKTQRSRNGAHDAAGGPGGAARRPAGDAGCGPGEDAGAVRRDPAGRSSRRPLRPRPRAPRPARAARGWHVIQRGESLWSIAAERLGTGASTASIAAEVERLWALNQDRIGTGDRNVVLAGTKIKL